ncbi:hypothetical protein [Pedobacter steynii]
MNELEEKVAMLEELFQGFVERVKVLESDIPKCLEGFLNAYHQSMSEIYGQIELSNRRYDHSKIQENIDATNKILASTPKVITVKNSHHFGSWTTSIIIAVTISFFLVAGSVGYCFYLHQQNRKLETDAFNFWLIRGLYPVPAQTVVDRFKENPAATIALTKKEIEKQNAIKVAKSKLDEAKRRTKSADENLKRVQSER